MDLETAQTTTTAKFPILKQGPVTTEEKVQKKNDVKARSMLLMALPNEHLLIFNQYKSAKTLLQKIIVEQEVKELQAHAQDLNMAFLCHLLACYMEDDEVPTNMALMAFSESERSSKRRSFEGYAPKTSKSVSEDISNEVKESPNAPLVEELVSDDKLEKKTIFPTISKIEFVRPKQQEKPVRKPANCNYHQRERVVSRNNYTRVNYNYSTQKAHPSAQRNMVPRAVLMKTGLRTLNNTRPVNTAHPKTTVYSARPMSHFSKSAQSTILKWCLRPKAVNTARPNLVVVNAVRVNQVNAVKASTCWVLRPSKLNNASITFKRHNYVDALGKSKSVMAWEHVLSLRLKELREDLLPLGEEPRRGRTLALSFMRPFGCHVTILNTLDYLGKFDGKSDDGFFVGYSLNSKAFRVYNIRTRNVEENLHISPILNTGSININIVSPTVTTARSNGSQTEPDMFSLGDNATLEATHADFFGDETEVDMSNITTTYLVPSTPKTRIHKDHSLEHVIGNVQFGVQIRRMTNEQGFISKVYERKTYKVLHIVCLACFLSQEEPKVRTRKMRGIMIRNKAKLFAQVYTQEEGIDYDEIEEEVYVCQPLGFKDLEFPDKVYMVEKALYGLRQAPRAWYETLSTYLLDNGFQRGQINMNLFIKRVKESFVLKGQPKLGLWYPKDSPFDLEAYTDSDYAGASLDRKSTIGGCQFLRRRLISWLQKIVNQLAILGENISQKDLNFKFLRSLPSEWNTHIVKQEVKGTASLSSSLSSQNMAFISSPSSTNEVNTAYGVSTANTQVSLASTQVSTSSTQVSTANLSDDTVYAFLASQPNGSQLVYEDLEQIHKDDIEEMDLKWQLALLSMRTRRTLCKECRGPRNQDSKNRNQDSSRRAVNVEETSSKAMVAIDGASFDWSYMADDEVPTNMALMAFSDSEKSNLSFTKRMRVIFTPNLDLSYSGLEEFQQPKFEGYGPKSSKSVSEDISNEVRESPDAPLVEELVSDDKLEKKIIFPTIAKIEFVRPKQQEKPVRKPRLMEPAFYHQREKGESGNNYTRVNYNYSAKKTHPSAHRNMVPKAVLMKTGLRSLNTARPVNTAHPKTTVYSARPMPKAINTTRPNSAVVNAVRANQGHPQKEDQGYVDSGCSRHMTRNMSYLSDFKEFNGGYVTFGGGAKGGKITGKGTLKTADESQVLLKVPRKNNMYSVDMKNIGKQHHSLCRFTWVFFLAYKDKTSGILKKFITEIENLVDKKVKIIIYDNGTEFTNRVISITIRTRKIEENLHIKFLEDKPIIASDGPKWLFDIDVLTKSMNYVQLLQNASNNEPQPSSDVGKKDDEGVNKESGIDDQEKPKNSTQDVNSVGPSINTASTDVNTGSLNINIVSLTVTTAPLEATYADFLCTSNEGINSYDEVFAPVARIEAIRLFLAYASFKDFVVYQMDVKSAFLYGKIEEEFYVYQPLGFEDPEFPDRVYKSRQVLDEILKKFDFLTVKTTSTPMETSKPLMKDEYAKDIDVHLYRSMIGSLMYLTSSRPDIMFTICACARFQVTPKVLHLYAVKRIFSYLKGQPKLGLWYPKDSPFNLEAYTDSDYTGASLDRKSTIRGCQFLGSRLISWQCKKQTIVTNSTTKAEYVVAASCCGQVLWIQNHMLDYGYNFMNIKIFIDNENTIYIVKNPVIHSKTKHIKIRQCFIRDSNKKKLILMIKIQTDQNVADLLTKTFDVGRFQYLIASLRMLNL
ncbi:ribonuclease H-like domain-containing protein [Tanacetum coccineum]